MMARRSICGPAGAISRPARVMNTSFCERIWSSRSRRNPAKPSRCRSTGSRILRARDGMRVTRISISPFRSEYQFLRKDLVLAESAQSGQTIKVPLDRFADFEGKRWYAGDTHIHFPDPSGVRYEMECEGLRVCSILLLKNGYKDGRPGDRSFIAADH